MTRWVLIVAWLLMLTACDHPDREAEQLISAWRKSPVDRVLTIQYPFNKSHFPPDIIAPKFIWSDTNECNAWVVCLTSSAGTYWHSSICQESFWRPSRRLWSDIQSQAVDDEIQVAIIGAQQDRLHQPRSAGVLTISISSDPVAAPIFYREVNLPFIDAVKDPSAIRWRFGSINDDRAPAVVLENLPVCGNCHSFSKNAELLAMDVDYANNKASYVITRLQKEIILSPKDIITWDDYERQDGQQTFGLLSQISPDGRYVISTVKDKSVFVATPGLEFSQLFFPIKGILVFYRRDTATFHALPGADDPAYVQSNPVWSPDGQYIVFARARAYQLQNASDPAKVLLSFDECAEFTQEKRPFQFDLYCIPFNEGRGGQPEPLPGASHNGKSNFFPKYSPDGKWIVFCQAQNYMLLQPDSELFIMPATGGQPQRLGGNTARMNSWHSWSPNGKWLVFSSKHFTPYTQLFLTHIDADGNSSPPVLLDHFTAKDRAANIPEFVNVSAAAIAHIRQEFLDDMSHARAAYALEMSGDTDAAVREYRKALSFNQTNAFVHQRLGFLLYNMKQQPEAGLAHTQEALRLDPRNGRACYDLGMILLDQENMELAIQTLKRAIQLAPQEKEHAYRLSAMKYNLGFALLLHEQYLESSTCLSEALSLEPDNAEIQYFLALALAHQGLIDKPLVLYNQAIASQPSLDRLPTLPDLIGMNCAQGGQFALAVECAQKALVLAQKTRQTDLANEINRRLSLYQQNQPDP